MMSNEEQLERICKAYEKKLIELMGISKFMAFSAKIATEMLKDDFLENFDAISSDENLQKFMGNIRIEKYDAITGSDEDYEIAKCFHCNHLKHHGTYALCELVGCDFSPKEADDGD